MKHYFEQYLTSQWNSSVYAEKVAVQGDFLVHTHDFYEMVIIAEGSGEHIVGGNAYPLSRGDVYVVKGDLAHGFRHADNLVIYNVMYSAAALQDVSRTLREIPGFEPLFMLEPMLRFDGAFKDKLALCEADLTFAESLINQIIAASSHKEKQGLVAAQSMFAALGAFLALRHDAPAASGAMRALFDATQYMRAHMAEEVPLSDVAGHIGLSVRHMSRLFERYYNVTPLHYLFDVRMRTAEMLLASTDKSVAQVARHCGYADSGYFSRVFRQSHNMSPSEYRLSCEGSAPRLW